jgi:hypothetical protein
MLAWVREGDEHYLRSFAAGGGGGASVGEERG